MNPKAVAVQVCLVTASLVGALTGTTWLWATALGALTLYTAWGVIG